MDYSFARLTRYDLGLFRLVGSGLGNLLFPWARFVVATGKMDLKPICPTWLQFQVGPIIRNESDKRFYGNLFRTPSEQLYGFEKMRLLVTLPHVSESEFLLGKAKGRGDRVVIFQGLGNFFSDILQEHALVRSELVRITRPEHKAGLEHDFRGTISVHVRLGDFFVLKESNVLNKGRMGYRIPFAWYTRVIEQLRKQTGDRLPVYIFSDGTQEELQELLALPDSCKMSFGSSIADLLALSQADILVTSASTFSAWASYLGRMPTVWYKGQRRRLYYEAPEAEAECDEEGEIPESFFACLERRARTQAADRREAAAEPPRG